MCFRMNAMGEDVLRVKDQTSHDSRSNQKANAHLIFLVQMPLCEALQYHVGVQVIENAFDAAHCVVRIGTFRQFVQPVIGHNIEMFAVEIVKSSV